VYDISTCLDMYRHIQALLIQIIHAECNVYILNCLMTDRTGPRLDK